MDPIFLVETVELLWHNLSSIFFYGWDGSSCLSKFAHKFCWHFNFQIDIQQNNNEVALNPTWILAIPNQFLVWVVVTQVEIALWWRLGVVNLEQALMEVQHKFRNVKVEKKANKLFEVSYKRPKDWSIDIKFTLF